jgi:dienelactone hydrolase
MALLFFAVLTAFGEEPKKRKSHVSQHDSSLPMEVVSFRGASGLLQGYFYKPDGKGSFPAVIFLPEMRKSLAKTGPASQFDELARFWTTKGYVFFIPDHLPRLTLAEIGSTNDPATTPEERYMDMLQAMHKDVEAATEWCKAQPMVDETRVVMMGSMLGAVQTIYAVERGIKVSALLPFSPAAMSWNSYPILQAAMRRGIRNAKIPIYLIQTQNDMSLAPSFILGKELLNKGGLNRTKVYPPFGTSNNDARNFAVKGSGIWGGDVIAFLKEALPQ